MLSRIAGKGRKERGRERGKEGKRRRQIERKRAEVDFKLKGQRMGCGGMDADRPPAKRGGLRNANEIRLRGGLSWSPHKAQKSGAE